MRPATWPRACAPCERLLSIDPVGGTVRDATVGELPELLRAGDLLVLNDAATLPASLPGHSASGADIELRLLGGTPVIAQHEHEHEHEFRAVLMGAGDWRTPTEHRPAPPPVAVGELLQLRGLAATVTAVSPLSPRLLTVRFDQRGAALWSALYRAGRPVQYAYLERPLALWHVQSGFASRPWAAEMPSAGRPLAWDTLLAARRRGIDLATLTHAAGLSSAGDPAIDAALPLPEHYELPATTIAAIARCHARGGRVVAVGTTVVRALEGNFATHGALRAGPGVTDLRLGPHSQLHVVDGILTGMHEAGSSHLELLSAFAARELLGRAYAHASAAGYLVHEFGDSNLILAA